MSAKYRDRTHSAKNQGFGPHQVDVELERIQGVMPKTNALINEVSSLGGGGGPDNVVF